MIARRIVPPKLVWGCLALTVVAIVALLGLNRQEQIALDRVRDRERLFERFFGDVHYLDEALSVTARLAVLTHDDGLRERYDSLDGQLRSALERVANLLAHASSRVAVAQLTAADNRLARIERSALAQLAAGKPASGDSLLSSLAYAAAKREYRESLRRVSALADAQIVAERAAAKRHATLSLLVGAGTLLLVGIAWAGLVMVLRGHLREQMLRSVELTTAKEMAEAANRSKDDFLATMSHELRTPLAAVIGFANVLQKNRGNRLGTADLAYVSRIQSNGRHLLSLIDEILDLARLESGRVDLVIAPTELGALVRSAAGLIEGELHGKEVRLVLDTPTEPVWVDTDGARLTQIVINLLANAIKFTESGSITLRVVPVFGSAGGARVAVSDTGCGIAADRLDAIFQPFEQADNTTARRHGGTGLGLTISRSLAGALGGSIGVESTPGVGSTFVVDLPASVPGHETRQTDTDADSRRLAISASRSRGVVLVVNDDPDAGEAIAEMVGDAGGRAVLASSGDEGLRMARELHPEAITLDLVMPAMNGMEVLQTLKADLQLRAIPVIIASVNADGVGSFLGAVDAIASPLGQDAVRDVLARHVETSEAGSSAVLIVESNAAVEAALRAQLQDAGVSAIRVAREAREALALLERHAPALVFLDPLLPGMSGIHLLRFLRLDVRWVHVPVVLVSARTLSETEARRVGQEASAVLLKRDDIRERLTRLLRTVIPNGTRESVAARPTDGQVLTNV